VSYIGNTPTNQNFVAGADQFNGNGSTTAFTLSRNVNTVFDIFVAISNVPQDPYSAYSVSGNTLTFTSAPPSGTGNIYVTYRATNVQYFVPSPLSVSTPQIVDSSITTAKIADSSITTAKIADANITAAKLDGAQSGSAPIYAARAWVNFNGTGTVAIRASGNVSSITDNGTGDYTINFTTAMSDANYSSVVSGGNKSNGYTVGTSEASAPTSSSFRVLNSYAGVGVQDATYVFATVFR
jgi:hypothetical protein